MSVPVVTYLIMTASNQIVSSGVPLYQIHDIYILHVDVNITGSNNVLRKVSVNLQSPQLFLIHKYMLCSRESVAMRHPYWCVGQYPQWLGVVDLTTT